MKTVAKGIHWLVLSQMVNVYLVEIDGGLMLVDTGFVRGARRLLRAIRSLAAGSGPLRHVVITHAHSDHTYNAAAVREATGATIWMHPADADALVTGAGNEAVMPPSRSSFGGLMPGRVPPAPVDGELVDGQPLPFAPDWRVIHTPGHTPGQCCFFHAGQRVLITGDSVMHWFGRLSQPFAAATVDMEQNLAGLRALADLDIEIALFGHGRPLRAGAGHALQAWLAALDA